MKKIVIITLASFVGLAGIAALATWMMIHSYETTPHAGNGKEMAVSIPRGTGPRAVSRLLADAGVIDEAVDFERYIHYYRRASGQIKAGELAFRDNMTPRQVLDVLLAGTPVTHSVTIPEGLRIDEVAELYSQAGLANKAKFVSRSRDKTFVKSLGLPGDSLEGFLFPDTYKFRKDTPLDEILGKMVAGYRQVFNAEWHKRAREIGMSELQVVTLASIVEKETGAASERALISGVFHNRLRDNWRLDTDPTVIYAVLLARGSFSGNLTQSDLKIDSPYNTYRHKGLPPGPICNPGREAIEAALFPEKTKYFFFVSKNDGTHFFCPTLACHNAAVRRFQGGG